MKLLVNDKSLDFEAPVHMSDRQIVKFVKFMRKLFSNLQIEGVEEKTKEIGNREITSRKWIPDEYLLLLTSQTNDDIARLTKRSEMSVKMMRGEFVPEFLVWAKKKGYHLPVKINVIKEFLSEVGK